MQLAEVSNILGGEKILGKKLASRMDLMELGSVGVTKRSLSHLTSLLSLSMKQMAELLPVTERTLQRYRSDHHLNRNVSEQIIHIAEVFAKGIEVFDEKTKLLLWLNAPHRVFSGKTPLSMLTSRFGVGLVLDELGRIEFGVYS